MTPFQQRLTLELELPPELADYKDSVVYGTLGGSLAVDVKANLQRGDRLHITVRTEDAEEVGTCVVRVVGVEFKDVVASGSVIATERLHKFKAVG